MEPNEAFDKSPTKVSIWVSLPNNILTQNNDLPHPAANMGYGRANPDPTLRLQLAQPQPSGSLEHGNPVSCNTWASGRGVFTKNLQPASISNCKTRLFFPPHVRLQRASARALLREAPPPECLHTALPKFKAPQVRLYFIRVWGQGTHAYLHRNIYTL